MDRSPRPVLRRLGTWTLRPNELVVLISANDEDSTAAQLQEPLWYFRSDVWDGCVERTCWKGHIRVFSWAYFQHCTKFVSTCQSRLPGFTAIPFTCIQRYILGTSMNSPNTKCTTMVRSRLHVKAQHKTGFKKQGLHASRCTRGEKQSTLLGM